MGKCAHGKLGKSLLSVLLTLSMVLQLLPASALAEAAGTDDLELPALEADTGAVDSTDDVEAEDSTTNENPASYDDGQDPDELRDGSADVEAVADSDEGDESDFGDAGPIDGGHSLEEVGIAVDGMAEGSELEAALEGDIELTVQLQTMRKNETISMGGWHSAAIKTDRSLWMWGSNAGGILGDGTTEAHLSPVKIMSDAVAVSLGHAHSAAIKSDGTLWTWGNNKYGLLGDGTTTSRTAPVKVMDDVVAVSLGGSHSAAIKTDGSLWMWGDNGGKLGIGTRATCYTPTKVMNDVACVSLGGMHSAAIKTDGTLWTWGFNGSGQLGDGTTDERLSPVKVMDDVVAVSLGGSHSAAIKTDGSLWMWGLNYTGALGDGTKTNRTTPVKVMDNVAAVSLGSGFSAAMKTDGTLWTWGYNGGGELGDGTTETRITPTEVLDKVATIAYSAAIRTDGSLWAWGTNAYGQIGDGTTTNRTTPVKVMDGVAIGNGSWQPEPGKTDIADTEVFINGINSEDGVTLDWTGDAVKPDVSLLLKTGVKLKFNEDYTYSYTDNVDTGTASATIQGKGSFTGTKTVHFSITYPSVMKYSFDDMWGFGNSRQWISESIFTNVFGKNYGWALYHALKEGDFTGGVCHGMVMSAISANGYGYPLPATFRQKVMGVPIGEPACLGDIKSYDSWYWGPNSTPAIDFIKYGQLAWWDPALQREVDQNGTNNLDAFVSAVANSVILHKGEPVAICVGNDDGAHELLAAGMGEDGPRRTEVKVYDCNSPYFDSYEFKSLYLFKDNDGNYIDWHYDDYNTNSKGELLWSTPGDALLGIMGRHGNFNPGAQDKLIITKKLSNKKVTLVIGGEQVELRSTTDGRVLHVKPVESDPPETDLPDAFWVDAGDSYSLTGLSGQEELLLASTSGAVIAKTFGATRIDYQDKSGNVPAITIAQSSGSAFELDFYSSDSGYASGGVNISGRGSSIVEAHGIGDGISVTGVSSLVVQDDKGNSTSSSVLDENKTYSVIPEGKDGKPEIVEDVAVSTQDMYRLYNPNSGEHFYTADAGERDQLDSIGWNYEGVGWIAPRRSTVPVHRLYNPNAGEHHYTLDAGERDALVRVGWKYEGIGWYSDPNNAVPMLREYNPNQFSCNHNYTADKVEHDHLISLGWRDEGVGWYAVSAPGHVSQVVAPTGVALDRSTITLEVGRNVSLAATVSPPDATDRTVTWSSSDTSVATVSGGTVSGVKAGTATVTVRTSNGKEASCAVTVKAAVVEATGIALNTASATVTVGKTLSLVATVLPENATDKSVTWSSSDLGVVKVDNGEVTCVAAGTAKVTAATSNGKTAVCVVTVKPATVEATGISLSQTSATVTVGGKLSLTATVTPSNATDKTVTWSSSDASVATVSGGTVTGVKVGTTTITSRTHNGKAATCVVTVRSATVDAAGVSLDRNSTTIKVGESVLLKATVSPSDATDKTVNWSSSDASVATVNGGTVTGVKVGTATVTARTSNGKEARCVVTVSAVEVAGISLSSVSASVVAGRTLELTATVTPSNATDRSVSWTTSNASVATVDDRGTVTAKAAGTATITAKTTNGKAATCVVTVRPATVEATGISLSQTSVTVTIGGKASLTATVLPSNTTDKTVIWSTSNFSVASVSNGDVVAKTAGSATITARTSNGIEAKCTVMVKEASGSRPSLPGKAIQVAAGGSHSAAVLEDGSLWLWGCNDQGQLGDGTYDNRTTPVKVMDGVMSVSLGYEHSAAIKRDGTLWLWGRNKYGSVGDGSGASRNSPVKVMNDVVYVALGSGTSAAIKRDGSLWVWGYHGQGDLGVGEPNSIFDCRLSPVMLAKGVAQVSMGSHAGGYVTTGGQLWTWGANAMSGVIGDGTRNNAVVPVHVMDGVKRVEMGFNATAAIRTDGSLWAWGSGSGLFENGVSAGGDSPVKLCDAAHEISLGADFALLQAANGSLLSAGLNRYGQLGNKGNDSLSRFAVIADGVLSCDAGDCHSVLIDETGTVHTWGCNEQGQLGNGSIENVNAIVLGK